ncbi:hypothetical protein SBY92_002812 [Candida maltosa Xu316]
MSLLPTRWVSRSIPFLESKKECIYGFVYDLHTFKYGFYLSNFDCVWQQELDKIGIIKQAKEIGIEDMNDTDLTHLLNLMNESIPDKLILKQDGDNIIGETTTETIWTFNLVKQDSEKTIQFLSKLNYQQFGNACYLKYQIDNLKQAIEVKDAYALFLATNFKQSHGMDLINNYKRNHRAEIEEIEKFNIQRWEKKTSIEYRNQRSKKKKSHEEELTYNIEKAVEGSWKFANMFYEDTPEEVELEQLSPIKFDALEDSQASLSRTQSQSQSQSQFSQLQFETQPSIPSSLPESPTKSSGFKRPQSSQSSSQGQSQRKKRKIGSLSKR